MTVPGLMAMNKSFMLIGRHGCGKTRLARILSRGYGEGGFVFYDATKDDLISIAGISDADEPLKRGAVEAFRYGIASKLQVKPVVLELIHRALQGLLSDGEVSDGERLRLELSGLVSFQERLEYVERHWTQAMGTGLAEVAHRARSSRRDDRMVQLAAGVPQGGDVMTPSWRIRIRRHVLKSEHPSDPFHIPGIGRYESCSDLTTRVGQEDVEDEAATYLS